MLSFVKTPLRFISSPRRVGTVVPSSRYLGEALRSGVWECDKIIELGSGEGAVTKILVEHFGHSGLTAVEFDHRAARILKKRFPGMNVQERCALEILKELPASEEKVGIVSCLPLRSLPKNLVKDLTNEMLSAIISGKASKLVQFTYSPFPPFDTPVGAKWVKIDTIWRNFPPAFVFELRKNNEQ